MTTAAPPAAPSPAAPRRRPLSKSLLLLTRTLHIYATMLALLLLFFFALTGFFLNHAALFETDEPQRVTDRQDALPAALAADTAADHKLKVVEYLRAKLGARGEMHSYDQQPDEARLPFTAPGRKTDFVIARADGAVQIHDELRSPLALLTDLHKGTGSGDLWRRAIDAAAIFLFVASLSGLILFFSLPKRRTVGLACLAAGIAACVVLFLLIP